MPYPLYQHPRSRGPDGQPRPGQFRRTQRVIDAAFEWLRLDQGDRGLALAREEIRRCHFDELSPHQRLDLRYILGCSSVAIGRYDEGVDALSHALDSALALHEYEAAIRIAYELGMANRSVSRVSKAIFYHARCVELLRDTPTRSPGGYLDLEVRALAELAMFSDFCGLRDDGRDWLRQAEQAASHLGPLHPQQGPIAWARARFLRDEGRPIEALKFAERACDIYAKVDNPSTYVRILFVTADIALDLADSLPLHASAREHFIELARLYAEPIASLACQHEDLSGLGLALLTDARLQLISRSQENRLVPLLHARDIALLRNDTVVLIQTYTAMGAELEYQQSYGPARNLYVQALDLARGPDLSALATIAALGLHRIDGLLRRRGRRRMGDD